MLTIVPRAERARNKETVACECRTGLRFSRGVALFPFCLYFDAFITSLIAMHGITVGCQKINYEYPIFITSSTYYHMLLTASAARQKLCLNERQVHNPTLQLFDRMRSWSHRMV